jgi:hypothetical protein
LGKSGATVYLQHLVELHVCAISTISFRPQKTSPYRTLLPFCLKHTDLAMMITAGGFTIVGSKKKTFEEELKRS